MDIKHENNSLVTPFEARRKKTICQLLFHKRWLVLCMLLTLAQLTKAQNPVAQFTSNTTSGCSPIAVQFTDQSTGNPVFWNWDLGNGQLSTLKNPVAIYSTPGTYTVTLVVRNATGIDAITKTNYIVVNPSPTATFTSDIRTACLPATIRFTDASIPNTGTITSWEWDFGDGTKSTLQNPVKTYNAVGFYTVTLSVTNSAGCKGSNIATNYIRIVSGVTADFNNTPPTTCQAPFITTFNNQTTGPGNITYQWDFGNATTSTLQNPSATYAASGTYTVQLTATSEFGCSTTVQKSVQIAGNNTSFTSPDSVCINSVVNFQNTAGTPPVSAFWDFGNGRQSNKISDTSSFATPGLYTVKLVNTYANCTDSVTRSIYVRPNPTVDFNAPNVISCSAPFTVNFQDLSPGAVSWQWNFGDGGTSTQQNPSHQYNTEGQFNVTLTIVDNKGCTNTITKSSFVRIVKPTVRVSNAPAGGCVGFTYNPVAVVNSIDGIASYFWDFGDGNTSTSPSPSNVYAAVGNYTLKLVVVTNGGCRDSVVYTNGIRVGTSPNTGFTASPLDVCPLDVVNFTVDPATIAQEWQWNFGDGGTSAVQNPSHNYSDTGYFSVTLNAVNNGCEQSVTRNLYIHVKPPIADFTTNVNCNNKRLVIFNNTSKTDAAYGPITYAWNFGDGSPIDNTINPTHTYATLATYTVTLTVTNGTCSHTFSRNIALNNDIADFTINKDTVCRNETFTVTAINSLPANIASYEWSFDGSPYTSLGATTQGYFTINGVHSISLAIRDVNGCTDTLTKTNALFVRGPVPAFNATTLGACRNSPVLFNDLTPPSNLVRWEFDFGDGATQTYTAPPFSHSYADTGTYTVTMKVTDINNCSATAIAATPVIITKPVVNFGADRPLVCPGANVQFRDSSSGKGLTYLWSFGDGTTSTLKDPLHSYAGSDSVYTVKLVVTDSVGCSDSLVKVNFITARVPKPLFDIRDTSSICPPLETKFVFRGRDYESYYWDFGDGNTLSPTRDSISYFYNNYGNFTPKLYVIGFGGCIDSASAQVNVYNPVSATTFNYNPLNACNSLTVDFNITTPPSTRFTFYSGDGFIDSSQNKVFQYFYKSFGYYYPSLYLTDSSKCLVSIGGSNRISIIGAEPLFGVDRKAFCDTGTVYFANFTIGNDPIVSSVWDFGDGNTSSVTEPSHTYSVPGTYFPSLTVTTQQGCSKTLSDTVRVYGTPNPIITADTVVCINEQLLLNGSLVLADTAITYNWSFGNGSTSNVQNPNTRYGSAGNYTITLEAVNKLGCKDTTSHRVMVPQNPVITFSGNPVIPVGTGINIPVTYSPNVTTYAWTPTQWLSCTNCPVPFAQPKSTTKYNVNVTDIYGCTSNNDITIVVVCNDRNFFIPNTFSPNNDGNNDVFYPRGNGVARVQSMRIFNRWGELVFERKNFAANDPALGWDGTFRGRKADSDAYVYIIELICENSVIVPHRGNVTLIR